METEKNDLVREQYTDMVDIYIDNILRLEEKKVVSKNFAGFLVSYLLKKGFTKELENYFQSIAFSVTHYTWAVKDG